MNRHKLGTQASGIAGMIAAQDILSTREEPTSTPVAYPVIGQDLTGANIEAGFGATEWMWRVMPQADYDVLLDLQGDTPSATMYTYTAKRNGASGIDFADFLATVHRPTFESRSELLCYGVRLSMTNMIEQ